jgi:hypothetical protein
MFSSRGTSALVSKNKRVVHNIQTCRHSHCFLDTGIKPFVCKLCQRAFSRQDSLMRHERLHSRQSNATTTLTPPAGISLPTTPESLDIEQVSGNGGVHFSSTNERQHQQSSACASSSVADINMIVPSSDLNFDLIWPDSESLLQTIFSADLTTQQPLSAGTFPFETYSILTASSIPNSFSSRGEAIESIPSGGNHRAVHDVSKMISSHVSCSIAEYVATLLTQV